MTIAACYLTDEGVVLGADSAQTDSVTNLQYNYTQKVFEVGDPGDYAVAIWGFGQFGDVSVRRLAALLSDKIAERGAPIPVRDLAEMWNDLLWDAFDALAVQLKPQLDRRLVLLDKSAKARQGLAEQLDATELQELMQLENLFAAANGGSCIAGKSMPDRIPAAYQVTFGVAAAKSSPVEIPKGAPTLWGVPDFVMRLFSGIDAGLFSAILGSGMWTGSQQDLMRLVAQSSLSVPQNLPLRDAVDFVHSTLQATIKSFKFAGGLSRVCGGPIDIGLITSDRPFRWVCHKSMYQAVEDSFIKEPWPWL